MAWLATIVTTVNQRLDDPSLAIGPSHFIRDDLDEEWAARIWRHAVLPSIEDAYYDQPDRVSQFSWEALRAASPQSDAEDADESDEGGAPVDVDDSSAG